MIVGFAFPEYNELLECREIVDDCLAGQKTIKEKSKYLPPNSWQREHPEQYHAFLNRALFQGETEYSIDIYDGLFSLGNPQITLPDDKKMNFILKRASASREDLKSIQLRLNTEQMTQGLRCNLLEVRQNAKYPFFIQEYHANKFLRSHFLDDDGDKIADLVLLNESTYYHDLASKKDVKDLKLRVLALDSNREYYQRRVAPQEYLDLDLKNPPVDERTIYPAYRKKRFNQIPFVWCGVKSISGEEFDYPPMLSLAQTELKLYMSIAHNSQHIYMNTQETVFITGQVTGNFDMRTLQFGAGASNFIPGKDIKVEYLSTNGVGFDAEEKEITRLKSDIEQKRLSLMSAKSHQSGTVLGMVQNSQSAPLRTISDWSGRALTRLLQYMAEWMGYSEEDVDKISYIPSQEYANPRVNLSEFIALCKAVIAGEVMMLEEDLYQMAKESNFINTDLTWQQFKEKYNLEQLERERKQSILPQEKGNPFSAE